MKVKAIKSFAGYYFSCTEGETYDLPDDDAKGLVKAGFVEPAEPEKKAPAKPAAKK